MINPLLKYCLKTGKPSKAAAVPAVWACTQLSYSFLKSSKDFIN